jgi:hypothetical protein
MIKPKKKKRNKFTTELSPLSKLDFLLSVIDLSNISDILLFDITIVLAKCFSFHHKYVNASLC